MKTSTSTQSFKDAHVRPLLKKRKRTEKLQIGIQLDFHFQNRIKNGFLAVL